MARVRDTGKGEQIVSLHACDCARFPERFSTSTSLCSLKLKSLHRFTSTAIAVEEITAIQEGKLGKGLKQFLSDEVVNKGKGKSRAPPGDIAGHTDEVWALALSPDGKYLASGGKDRRVGVWDVEKEEWVKGFGGHRDCISVSLVYCAALMCSV